LVKIKQLIGDGQLLRKKYEQRGFEIKQLGQKMSNYDASHEKELERIAKKHAEEIDYMEDQVS